MAGWEDLFVSAMLFMARFKVHFVNPVALLIITKSKQ